MPCFHPMRAWYSKDVNLKSGKRSMVFLPSMALQPDAPLSLPCGQCIGCRLERSRQWATRCIHEARMHNDNCFITLTYDPMFLPDDGGLDKIAFVNFMKRLRDRFDYVGSDGKTGIRFYMCGEYGEENKRPHYHACLFNFDFTDKVHWSSPNGNRLYISETLGELWPYGFSTIGDVTFESAAYVARYIMKKVTGEAADDHYFDPSTGVYLQPEYNNMSRRPGIGKSFVDCFGGDIYPHDSVSLNGVKVRPPRYYDKLLERTDPFAFDIVKERREIAAKLFVDNNTRDRLNVREQVALARLSQLNRKEV